MIFLNDLVQLLKQIASEAVEGGKPAKLIYGEVLKVQPLAIQIEQKLTLTADFFELTKNVLDYYVDVTVSHVTEAQSGGSGDAAFASHNHEYLGRKRILVHNGLRVGERVLLLQAQGGQKYLVLDRVVDHTVEGEWL